MANTRPRTREWRAPTCPWCDAQMREHDRDVWLCSRDSCSGAAFGRSAVRPLCPLHHRRMERLGDFWLCPEGCRYEIPWEQVRAGRGKGERPEEEDEGDPPRPLVIKRGRGGRRRSRYSSPLKRRWLEWLRRRRRAIPP